MLNQVESKICHARLRVRYFCSGYTIVNVNTVLLASRTFEFENNHVQFDGWTAFVRDTEVLEEVKELRKAIRLGMQKAIFNGCQFAVEKQATIIPLLDFLKKDIFVENIKGIRMQKAI